MFQLFPARVGDATNCFRHIPAVLVSMRRARLRHLNLNLYSRDLADPPEARTTAR